MQPRHIHSFDALVLFLGDLLVLYGALWFSLLFRFGEVPSQEIVVQHVVPFSVLFVIWLVIFYIGGLYEKQTRVLEHDLPETLFHVQVVNTLLAFLFFYLIPYFGITPKVVLFVYLIVSFVLIVVWRTKLFWLFVRRMPENALVIGSGEDVDELVTEIQDNQHYGLFIVGAVTLDEEHNKDGMAHIFERIVQDNVRVVIIDTHNEKFIPFLPELYALLFSQVRFLSLHHVYEDMCDRVPLSLVEHSWMLENISVTEKTPYEFVKRLMDIVIALPLFIILSPIYLLVWVALQIEGKGPFFYMAERVGRHNKTITIPKIRTMTGMDVGDEALQTQHTVTRVGQVLRTTRIDELPQLWSVLKGDLSLIGPRPEMPALAAEYAREVPHYNLRHLVKPGLSGWGQIKDYDVPREGVDVFKTAKKLSYDLYYIKHRSFFLDFKIALKTVKTLLSRAGR